MENQYFNKECACCPTGSEISMTTVFSKFYLTFNIDIIHKGIADVKLVLLFIHYA